MFTVVDISVLGLMLIYPSNDLVEGQITRLKIPCKHSNTPRLMQCLYICQVSRQLIENKNDLLKIDKTNMAAAASFQISHENGQY